MVSATARGNGLTRSPTIIRGVGSLHFPVPSNFRRSVKIRPVAFDYAAETCHLCRQGLSLPSLCLYVVLEGFTSCSHVAVPMSKRLVRSITHRSDIVLFVVRLPVSETILARRSCQSRFHDAHNLKKSRPRRPPTEPCDIKSPYLVEAEQKRTQKSGRHWNVDLATTINNNVRSHVA
ncbi:hypothetical protein HPB48_007163 [Haemaphysalis longicornis]|uniref:Uncharacterized protein n=1 Tax=Haemaphysalis longicornis TaxID=44386 RepID=A0A9J6GTY4_HAELO|nr:hypothetical protein HPB48_007163 [Haemaphysalis longicornis]